MSPCDGSRQKLRVCLHLLKLCRMTFFSGPGVYNFAMMNAFSNGRSDREITEKCSLSTAP